MARGRLSVVAAFCGGVAACSGGGGSGSNDAATRGAPDAAPGPLAARVNRTIWDASVWPDASPFGANCGEEDECDSNCCVDFHCTVACDPDDARACRDVVGLCAVVRNGRHACVGDVSSSADDLVLHADSTTKAFASVGSVTVVRLAVPRGSWRLVATPAADVDLAVDFYDARALELGTADEGVASAAELVSWTADDDLGAFVVVRHVGGAAGSYELRLDAVLP